MGVEGVERVETAVETLKGEGNETTWEQLFQ